MRRLRRKIGGHSDRQIQYSRCFSEAQQKGQSILKAFPTSPEAETLLTIATILKQKWNESEAEEQK
jgi:hypothetical protein